MILSSALNVLARQDDYVVYTYSIPGNEPPFYVGKGHPDRPKQHFEPNRRSATTRFYRKLNSLLALGIIPIITIVASGLSSSDACDVEKRLIKQYGRLDQGTGCLCNHTDGGDGTTGSVGRLGTEQSIDTRIKMSKPHSRQHVINQTASLRASVGRPVESFNLRTGTTIKRYPSQGAAREDGYNQGNISNAVRGCISQAYGYGWRYST